MMTKPFLPSLMLSLVLALSGFVQAETLTILGNHKKPPKSYVDDGEAQGILIDIMNYALDKLDTTGNFQLTPWSRAYNSALNGRGGIIGLSMTTERQQLFDFSDVMYYEELILVVRDDAVFDYQSIEDLRGKVVSFQRGATFGDDFEAARKDLFIGAEDDSIEQRLLKLLNGRVDVAIIGPGVHAFNTVLSANRTLAASRDRFRILPKPFKRDPNYLGFAKSLKMDDFLLRFNQVLAEGNRNGDISRILARYK